MKFKLILIIASIIITAPLPVPPELKSICPNGCSKLYRCDPIEKKCVYKGIFPIYPSEIIELIVVSVTSFFTQICGASGGIIYSNLFEEVQQFPKLESYTMTSLIILSSALAVYIIGIVDKLGEEIHPFVDYDLALLFCPLMLLGTKIGYILEKILSQFLISFIVSIILLFCLFYTYKNLVKERQKFNEVLSDKLEPLLSDYNGNNKYTNAFVNLTRNEEAILSRIRNPFIPLNPHLLVIMMSFILALIDLLLEGNLTFQSLVGIRVCSAWYWVIFSLYVTLLLGMLFLVMIIVKHSNTKRRQTNPKLANEKMENIVKNKIKVSLVGLIAGISSQLIGIGGGMVITPFLCSFKYNVIEAAMSSNFIVLVLFIATSIIYMASSQINYQFLLMVNIPCIIFSSIGGYYFLKKYHTTQKGSIILKILFGIILASLIIEMLHEGAFIIFNYTSFWDLLQINSFCV